MSKKNKWDTPDYSRNPKAGRGMKTGKIEEKKKKEVKYTLIGDRAVRDDWWNTTGGQVLIFIAIICFLVALATMYKPHLMIN